MIQLAVMLLLTKGNGASRGGVPTGGPCAVYQQTFDAALSTATTGARAQADSLQRVAQQKK